MPPIASRASRIAKVLPGDSCPQVAGGADAGEAGTDDQDVDVFERRSLVASAVAGSMGAEIINTLSTR